MPPYCICGHEHDEHHLGAVLFFCCQVDGCLCDDYDADPDCPEER